MCVKTATLTANLQLENCQLPLDKAAEFILAGKSLFTIKKIKDPKGQRDRFTFKVKRAKKPYFQDQYYYFVYVLAGADNTGDYVFLGSYSRQTGYRHSPKSRFSVECVSTQLAKWLFNKIDLKNLYQYDQLIKIYHENRCGRCGRVLTVPESVVSGFGPECIHLINKGK